MTPEPEELIALRWLLEKKQLEDVTLIMSAKYIVLAVPTVLVALTLLYAMDQLEEVTVRIYNFIVFT